MARPWFVIVMGEPGSGKSTLALEIAKELRLPHVGRDQVRAGLLATDGVWTNQLSDPSPREAAVEAFTRIVETMRAEGVSAVLEFLVMPDRVGAFQRITGAANCVIVRTECADAPARAHERDRADPLMSRPDVLAALGYDSVDAYAQHNAQQGDVVRENMQTEFDLPTLPVRTDDGYDPPLDEIIDWIVDQTRRNPASRSITDA
jgi:hypothetical protein